MIRFKYLLVLRDKTSQIDIFFPYKSKIDALEHARAYALSDEYECHVCEVLQSFGYYEEV